MRKSFTAKYDYGDVVFLKSDPGVKRVVSAYVLRKDCKTMYLLRVGDDETGFYEDDISPCSRPIVIKGFKR